MSQRSGPARHLTTALSLAVIAALGWGLYRIIADLVTVTANGQIFDAYGRLTWASALVAAAVVLGLIAVQAGNLCVRLRPAPDTPTED
ncbi:hypothetical protein ACIRLA_46520 [Streptomyces sp. NPDC102364]|uniref:hypothetical protein n=1 Tax=Streptomyces sp. NPDC102364 TaxID=3366161 RepID=UPI003820BCF3